MTYKMIVKLFMLPLCIIIMLIMCMNIQLCQLCAWIFKINQTNDGLNTLFDYRKH